MSALYEFHDEAMDLAFFARRARRRGDEDEAAPMFAEALKKELAALDELYKFGEAVEPAYSVLHRSAASLALTCGDSRLAEKLAAKALSEDPPPEIAQELRDVLERAAFQRHPAAKGVAPSIGEMRISLSGREVGFGVIPYGEIMERLACSTKLIHRTAERLNGLPFRERGGPPKDIKDIFQSFLSIPEVGSFAVTIKFGRANGGSDRPGGDIFAVMDEFIETIRLLDERGTPGLHDRIPDPRYFDNFIKLAKRIAPDGDRVDQVGFEFISRGVQRSVEFCRSRRSIASPPR